MNRRSPTPVVLACLLVTACAPQGVRNPLMGANVISTAGGNVIAPGGANVVAAGGGNLQASATTSANPFGMPTTVRLPMPASVVAPGGGNYRVFDVPAPDALAKGVRDNTHIYTDTTTLIDGILKGVAQAHLVPGRALTFPDPNQKSRNLTVLLEVKSDHALISIGTGDSAKGDTQVMGLSYTSPKKGRAVFHFVDAHQAKIHLATDFDLDANQAGADGAIDATKATSGDKQLVVGHWEFNRHPDAKADESAFTMAGSVFVHKPAKVADDGVLAFAAAFLPDDTGAFLFGVQAQGTGDRFVFLPRDGVSFLANPPADHDFYMTAQGADLPKEDAREALRGIVPADSAIYKPFPADPTKQDPFKDARFAFPD